MEIAALNERLRDAFTPVVKHLARLERLERLRASPRAVAAPPTDAVAVGAVPLSPSANAAPPTPAAATGDARQYRAHGLTVLARLNTYQYGTRAAFARELQQLEQLAASEEAARLVQGVLASVKDRERPAASDAPAAKRSKKAAAPAVTLHGLRFSYSGVPAFQQARRAAAASASDSGQAPWRCNVNVQDAVLTMGERESPAAALALYEARRAELAQSAHGLASLLQLSSQRRAAQQLADDKALRDAAEACIPRLASSTAVRVPDLVAPARPSDERPPTVSSPTSSASSAISAATPSAGTAASWRNPKRKKPAHRLAFLRLRRLIQKKLCPHLRGQPVCVFSRPENAEKADAGAWLPTGKLEGGRVVVLNTRKQLTFTEYVASELGHPASACAHMFLVRSRQSIDDHLKVCDAFSEEDREQLGHDLYGSVRNYMQAKDERR